MSSHLCPRHAPPLLSISASRYARASPPTKAFLEGLHTYISANQDEWEQKAYQLIVMRYLVGLGDELVLHRVDE